MYSIHMYLHFYFSGLHLQISKPVFLKGKSSLLSTGDGRVYWQVGDVPPRGEELWSSDVWWEDLLIQE